MAAIALACGSPIAAEDAAMEHQADRMALVEGPWNYAGQDCDPDNHFEPPAGISGSAFTLARDHTYSLAMAGKASSGTFAITPYAGLGSDDFLVVLEEADLSFIFSFDRLESRSGEEGVAQCTQIFERPA